jgi:hypothetical protein
MFTFGAGTFTFVHCTRVCARVSACVRVNVHATSARAHPAIDIMPT